LIQSHPNRVEALKSILPLLELHLDLISRVRSALGSAWESEPSPLDQPPKPRLLTPDMLCTVNCAECEDRVHCRDEAWMLQALALRHTYHLDAVTESLEHLAGTALWGRQWASAVYWQYVERWTSWNPKRRLEWSERGLDFMVEDVAVDLQMFRVGNRQTGEVSRKDEIVSLREAGLSYHAIAQQLGCSKTTVSAALSGGRVRSGRIVYASSP